ncbi:MAG: hypothetical protein IPH75_01205 [bacterium]|nr:hypothetical protein [bacterium]
MKNFFITMALFCSFAANSEGAGGGTIKIDEIRCEAWEPYSFHTNGNVRFVIRFSNDTGDRVSIRNDFVIKSIGVPYGYISIDTTVDMNWHSAFAAYFNLGFGLSEYPPLSVLSVEGAGGPGLGLPIGFDDTVLAITVWDVPPEAQLRQICIDTTTGIPMTSTWKWSTSMGIEFAPDFVGLDASQPYVPGYGYCFVAIMPCIPPAPARVVESLAHCGCMRCCQGTTGNIDLQGEIDLSDLSVLIAFLTQTPRPALACPEEANIDDRGMTDLSDLSRLIAYLTTTPRPWLPACP